MATPLHDVDALEALAEGDPGPARDWANVRLALRGARVRHLPSDPWEAAICLAAGASPADVLARVRAEGRKDPVAAELVEAVGAFGALPEDPEPWVEALRGAIRGAGRSADLWYARALADLGALDGDALAAASRVEDDDAPAVLPALVLRFAEARGADLAGVARQIAPRLARADARRPGVIAWTLAGLGVPVFALAVPDPEVALAVGARVAGAEPPAIPPSHGSARRRARRTAQTLLHGRPGPAAALVRALAEEEDPDGAELVAAAAWIALRPAADPLGAVLRHGAGEDRPTLAAARRGVSAADAPAVAVAVASEDLRSTPPSALAALLLARDGGPDELVAALYERAAARRRADRRTDVAACLAFARRPERVADFLADPGARDLGLLHARWCDTEEVLGALLELPLPAEPDRRVLYAWALADQGDRTALARLRELAARFPDEEPLGEVLARAEGVLGG